MQSSPHPFRDHPLSTAIMIPTWIGVAVQLTLSHGAAVLIVAALLRQDMPLLIAITGGLFGGMALTLPLQRTLWVLDSALARSQQAHPVTESARRWHGALSGFAFRVLALVEASTEVSDLRENLVGQVRDTAAQQERNRLARELHDSIKQQIFSIGMSAAAAETRFDHDAAGAQAALADIRRSAQEAMVEMNALLQQLAPAPLEKVGLQQALRDQCEALGYRTGAAVSVEFGTLPPDHRLPPGAQTSLFRIAQEALSNVARHARASNVKVFLGQREPEAALELCINDDGQGFDPASIATGGGMGLANIRERTLAMRGALQLDSRPGHGSSLHIVLPLLDTTDSQEEQLMIRPDATLNKIIAVGIAGGLLLIAVLFYPLYMVLPGSSVPGWPHSSPLLGLLLQTVGFGAAIGVGYVAARQTKAGSRPIGVLFGGVAGGLAGLVTFGGLAVGAAGLLSNLPLIRHDLVPAIDEIQAMSLLTNSVVWTIWGTYGGLLLALLAGIGLGAVGGLLYLPTATAQPLDWRTLRAALKSTLITASFAGGIGYLATTTVYGLLEPAIERSISTYKLGIPPALTVGIAGIPLAIAALLHLLPLSGIYLMLRHEREEDPLHSIWCDRPLANTILYAGLAIPSPLALLLSGTEAGGAVFGIVLLAAPLGAVILWILIARLCLEARAEQERAGLVARLTIGLVVRTVLGAVLVAVAFTLFCVVVVGPISFLAITGREVWPVLFGYGLFTLGALVVIRRRSRRTARQATSPTRHSQASEWQAHLNGILPTWAALMAIMVANAAAAANMTLVPVPIIPTLFAYNPATGASQVAQSHLLTMQDVVSGLYLGHAQIFFGVVLAASILVGLLTLVMWGVVTLSGRRSNRNIPAGTVA